MWVDVREASLRSARRGKGNRRRQQLLDVSTRLHSKNSQDNYKIAAVILIVLLAVVVSVLVWIGFRKMYTQNNHFIVKKIVIEGCRTTKPEVVREWTRITEGINLMEFSISEVRSDFLKKAHGIKELEISRIFPDTITMTVFERTALARIAGERMLVLDHDGVVFSMGNEAGDLPQIRGFKNVRFMPGVRVENLALAGLELLDACRFNLKDALEVVAIDVNREDFLILHLRDGRRVRFAWNGMNERNETSRSNLCKKLKNVADSLKTEKAMRLIEFDATLDDGRFIGSPELSRL